MMARFYRLPSRPNRSTPKSRGGKSRQDASSGGGGVECIRRSWGIF